MARRLRFLTVLAILIGVPLFSWAPIATADELANFITRQGDQLMDGDQPFRFIAFNIPNLIVVEDAYEFTRPNPWRWPDEYEIEDALESVRQMGGQVVRTYVISVYREGSDMGDCVHVRRPGEFNEEGFCTLDKVVEVARGKGIRVIIPFVDQAKWWGGIGEYAAFRGQPAEAFWTHRQIIDDFKATVRHVVTRKNTFTGVAYRDEPAIFGWETGNEINATPEWTREIAAYIKELDGNHVVIDGRSLGGVLLSSLDDPNVDMITTHHYPWGEDHDFARPIRAAHALTKGKKAYFVGEFGFVETPHLASAIDAIVDDGISGGLLWSLRFHRREGGFYWHMEVGTGQNIYKAFHWPGFTSGDRYDERQVLQLVREKAYAIRGLEPPPLEPPAPPKLLPIERVSAISWQGSAGAATYDIWRADERGTDNPVRRSLKTDKIVRPIGPWAKIAENVSDADVQYRPLLNDETAAPGQEYWYRVVARNAAGESEPSNVVGPVAVECRTLLDECRDLSLTNATQGDVSIASENARTAQEDCHRLAMRAGSAVSYRVGGPISRWRVYGFAPKVDAELAISVAADGEDFQPVESARRAYPSAQNVYGYLTPVLFEGEPQVQGGRYLRIALPDAATAPTAGAAPLEIGRVEIEYDRLPSSPAAPVEQKSAQAAPVSATVFVGGPRWLPNTLAAIDAVADRGDRRLNVVVTILVDLTADLRIRNYGRFRGWGLGLQPYDDAMRDEFRNALRQVFARMVHYDMEIFILPHIDAGGKVHEWRNWIGFDPLEPYAGYTYEQLMIDSIGDALAETAKADTHVELALSGEMGTSLFRYPESYRKIVRSLRERPDLKQLKVGVSLNHGGIAGEGNPTGVADIELTDGKRQQMQKLIEECDFIGMSFYRPVRVDVSTADFVRGIEHFMGEFEQHGLTVPTSKPMHFSEVGIGGGDEEGNMTDDPAEAVRSPWAGTGNPEDNPWAKNDAMRDLRRRYHRALLDFLTHQPAPWRVSAAFFWSTGSWDPQGMRHAEFADPEINRAIKEHNRATDR